MKLCLDIDVTLLKGLVVQSVRKAGHGEGQILAVSIH